MNSINKICKKESEWKKKDARDGENCVRKDEREK